MRHRLGFAGATALALALPLFSSPAATAATSSVSSTSVSSAAIDALCAATPEETAALARSTPKSRTHADTPAVTSADVAAATSEAPRLMARQAERALPANVRIPVHVTLVRGKHRGDTNRKPAEVKSWITLLNRAYAGKQSSASAATKYTFVLASVRQRKNDRWYHAVGNSRYDQQMRRQLHRGTAGTLNLYVTRPGQGNSGILGFARFPWQYSSTPRQDGVTVNVGSMPGGNVRGYNQGDTLVHEVGHWMGLFHTFQGGCGDPNRPTSTGDLIADTAPEREPNFTCQTTRNTCTAGETAGTVSFDPVRNFMDYSLDACMNMFTAGQSAQMDTVFNKYRYKR